MKNINFYRQHDEMDCGPTCLRVVAKWYGKSYDLEYLRELCSITRQGVSLLGISEGAEQIGLKTLSVLIKFRSLNEDVELPAIVHWRQRHFVVVYKITKTKVYVADPAFGKIVYSIKEFIDGWIGENTNKDEGIVLLLEPTPDFYNQNEDLENNKQKKGLLGLLPYLTPYRKLVIQAIIGLIASSLLQLTFPFLTQSIVDYGVTNQNLNFIFIILIAQLMLFFSRTVIEVIRSWILLHVGTRVSIALSSNFLRKLMKLPIGFFDSKNTGDIMQRINDGERIESFLSSTTLNTVFSMFNFIVFSFVLGYYSFIIFLIFLIGSSLYIGWSLLFLKKRAVLDHKRFDQMSSNSSKVIQLVQGMQEIKLNGSEQRRRWEWEEIQVKLFKVNIKSLALSQYQETGGSFFNEFKNILITFVAAYAVIKGDMTLGMMLAVQYIIGQLNGPIAQFIGFIQIAQDARISLDRFNEIHDKKNEELNSELTSNDINLRESIQINNVSFKYGGSDSPFVLKNLNFKIPAGKVTAIVGASGSGKTTLVKLLLKFYPPSGGEICIGNKNIEAVNTRFWRKSCGAVMQDGFIFGDTITRNISESETGLIDKEKLIKSVKIANLKEFVEELPLNYRTKIGAEGIGMSGGQKQRILIARAVYKDPEFVFFDEATSALDANNEKIIMENLEQFYENKTVLVIAHRLSTVKNADQIIVLNKGEVAEIGTHTELTANRGLYYELVKNQLELGN